MAAISDFIFPRRCLNCGQKGDWICTDCQKNLSAVARQICPICQKSSFAGQTHSRCQRKNKLDGLFCGFHYRGAIRKAILDFKFEAVVGLGKTLSFLLFQRLAESGLLSYWQQHQFVLVPLPLHRYRQRWRGFSQTEILAEKIAKIAGLACRHDWLQRQILRRPQVGLSRIEREANISGQFMVFPAAERDLNRQKIILVDDIWTTGATLKEGAAALKRNGVDKVWGLTVCRGGP